MTFEWLNWSNPVAIWWVFLVCVSFLNINFWIWTRIYLYKKNVGKNYVNLMVWLSAMYVFGCAFRSVLPRADVQKITLFDSWLNTVLVGRTVATIAELSFVAQWALVIYLLAREHQNKTALSISKTIIPLIFIAECFSWYAVITTNYIGNTIEESLWATTYTLIAVAIMFLWSHLKGPLKHAANIAIIGSLIYVAFMVLVDVPMYFNRWLSDQLFKKDYYGLIDGLIQLASVTNVTHDIHQWRDEIPWMSLYFSVAVWTSIALCYVPIIRNKRK